ncbi:MAG: cytochrome c [Oceanospirillaceae bacterium]|nr:cytochrome c [Oceanospirillaceae bacterium]MBT4444049.1 cytochrome c [Oceanospirillaceae bacterium]MBT6077135.1 cytochrome c [Oceanospirillaceae bacterium]
MNNTFKTVILLLTTFTLANPLYAAHNISHVDVSVGDLSNIASKGQVVFNTNCAQCHGVDAAGGIGGPPLIHNIYDPGHHANEAFIRAVRNGVRQHHWQFGDMAFLLKFVREVQQQNGITSMAYTM